MQQTQLTRQYVSSIAFMDKREILSQELDVFGEMDQLVDIMEMTDRYVPTSQEEYVLHANTRLHSAAEVAGTGAPEPAAGADSVITFTAGSVKPRRNDIMLSPGRFRAIVVDVTGNDVTVRPLDEDKVAHEALLVGDRIGFFSNAYGEGTGVEPGYVYPTRQFFNNIQIIKGDFSVTDLQGMTQVEVNYQGQPYYMIKGQADAFNRFRLDVGMTFLFGERSNGLEIDGRRIWTTHGLEQSIRQNGIDLPLRTDTMENFETDFKAITRALDQARGPSEYWMWNGPDIGNHIDDWLMTKEGLKGGGIVYNSFNGIDGKARAVQMGFDSFRLYDRTWHKKKLLVLDNVEVTVDPGYPSTSFMIPANKVPVNHDTGYVDRFRIRYMEAPKNQGFGVTSSREYYEIVTGGLAATPTNKEMRFDVSYATWQGCEYTGLEHFAINSFS